MFGNGRYEYGFFMPFPVSAQSVLPPEAEVAKVRHRRSDVRTGLIGVTDVEKKESLCPRPNWRMRTDPQVLISY